MKYERYPDELAHYGVKGMKWGVRKQYRTLRKEYKQSVKKAKKASDKNVKLFIRDTNNNGIVTEEEAFERKNAVKKLYDSWDDARIKAQKADDFANDNGIIVKNGKTAVNDLLKKDRKYNSLEYYANRYASAESRKETTKLLASVGGLAIASIAVATAVDVARLKL